MTTKFTKAADKAHEILLQSYFVSVDWAQNHAPVGGNVKFEIVTAFVGHGAPVEITIRDSGGKKLGKTIKGKVRRNRYTGIFIVPENINIGENICFEVNLSDNDLQGTSDYIPVMPKINVTNLHWSEKEARRGDVVVLSADVIGCYDNTDAKIIIYEYDNDGAHDKAYEFNTKVTNGKIEAKWECSYHLDTDEIPSEAELKKYGKTYNPPEYFFVIEIGGQKFGSNQESGLLTFKDWIIIILKDIGGLGIANAEYTLTLPDSTERKGKLDDHGILREDAIPPGPCQITFNAIKAVSPCSGRAPSTGLSCGTEVFTISSGKTHDFRGPEIKPLLLLPRSRKNLVPNGRKVDIKPLLSEYYPLNGDSFNGNVHKIEFKFFPDINTTRSISAFVTVVINQERRPDIGRRVFWRLNRKQSSGEARLSAAESITDDYGVALISVTHPAKTPSAGPSKIEIQASLTEDFVEFETMTLSICRNDDVDISLKKVRDGESLMVFQKQHNQISEGVRELQRLLNQVVARHKEAMEFKWLAMDGAYGVNCQKAVELFLDCFKGDFDYKHGHFNVRMDERLVKYLETEYGKKIQNGMIVDRSVLVGRSTWHPGHAIENISGLMDIYRGIVERYFDQINLRTREYMENCNVEWLHDPRDGKYKQGFWCVRVLRNKKLSVKPGGSQDKVRDLNGSDIEVPEMSILAFLHGPKSMNIDWFGNRLYNIISVKCDGVWYEVETPWKREVTGWILESNITEFDMAFSQASRSDNDETVNENMACSMNEDLTLVYVYSKPSLDSDRILNAYGKEIVIDAISIFKNKMSSIEKPKYEVIEIKKDRGGGRTWYKIRFEYLMRGTGWVLDRGMRDIFASIDSETELGKNDVSGQKKYKIYSAPSVNVEIVKDVNGKDVEVAKGTRLFHKPNDISRSGDEYSWYRLYIRTKLENAWYNIDYSDQYSGWVSSRYTREIRNDRSCRENLGTFGGFGMAYGWGQKDIPPEYVKRLKKYKPNDAIILCWEEYDDGCKPGQRGSDSRSGLSGWIGCDCSGFVQNCVTYAMLNVGAAKDNESPEERYATFANAGQSNGDRIISDSIIKRIERAKQGGFQNCVAAKGFIGRYARKIPYYSKKKEWQLLDMGDIISTPNHVALVADHAPDIMHNRRDFYIFNAMGNYERFNESPRVPDDCFIRKSVKMKFKWWGIYCGQAGVDLGRLYFWQ